MQRTNELLMEKSYLDKTFLKKIFIIFLSLIGLLTTVKLAMIYYESNFDPYALPSFCSVNEFIDCDGIAQTTHSQFFGIPLAYWGMFLYIFIIFLVFVDKLQKNKFLSFLKVFKNPLCYISALGLVSFIISIILAGVSVFEIKKICILCFFTYFLNLLIALIATDFKAGIINGFKLSILDFVEALKIKKYLISFITLTILASGFLAYTSISYCFTPQVKRHNAIAKYADMKTNPYKISGNILGDANGKLLVYVYTDYRCPICRVYNVMLYRAAQELDGFKFIHKNLPLDIDCNKHLKKPFHEGSCMLAKYSIASEQQGRLWELNSEFFEKEPKDENAVLKLAKTLGFDTIKLKQDANSISTIERLNKDIEDSAELRIDGTPTIVINGKIYSGIKPYYELKEILMKAGANEKK